MVYGSRQMLSKLSDFLVTLLGKDIQPSLYVKDLGVIFDQTLSFDEHTIKNVFFVHVDFRSDKSREACI